VTPNPAPNPAAVKQCCANLYETDAARLLLGNSFHPGGLALTERLGALLELNPSSHLLDIAAGNGTSALYLAERFGCRVTGIDLSAENVARANAAAQSRNLADRVQFQAADAESLPFPNTSFDTLLCECAFCTFPSKAAAASEFARVLQPGGKLGLSDLTRSPQLPEELQTLMAWVACIADAQPIEQYRSILQSAGFTLALTEPHDSALSDMVRQIRTRLLAFEIARGLGKISVPNFDLTAAKQMAAAAQDAIAQDRLGYVIMTATISKPRPDAP
jgi:arsenite methyltransferase